MSSYYENERKHYKVDKKSYKSTFAETVKDILLLDSVDWNERNLRKETLERYGVKCKTSTEIGPTSIEKVYFPYYSQENKLCGYKVKDLTKDKHEGGHFYTVGHVGVDCQLFGQRECRGSKNNLRLVEGEVDLLSAYQALEDYQKSENTLEKYRSLKPQVASPGCGTVHAVEHISNNSDFIDSYKNIWLAFDNDELNDVELKKKNPGMKGRECTQAVGVALIHKKIIVIDWPTYYNDCSDVLQKGKSEELAKILLFSKKEFKVDKIVSFNEVLTFEEAFSPVSYGLKVDAFPKLTEKLKGFRPYEFTVLTTFAGVGKCYQKGTKILMFNGETKPVEELKIGDTLLGVDGRQRNILKIHSGKDLMYKIKQVKGMDYIVNSKHILSLVPSLTIKKRGWIKNSIINISIQDFLNLPPSIQNSLKGWVPDEMNFNKGSSPFEPWAIGNWLADGSLNCGGLTVNIEDKEIINEWKKVSDRNNFEFSLKDYDSQKHTKGKRLSINNGLLLKLREIGIEKEKYVPYEYKFSSVQDRINLLSGILDGDGYKIHNGYEICFKSERLCDDIAFVARSLGFRVTIRDKFCSCTNFSGNIYKRMFIFGDTDKLNLRLKRKQCTQRKQIKNHRHTGISISSLYTDDYYGFEIDGDHLHLLSDFTVSHNSTIAVEVAYEAAIQGKRVGLIMLEEGNKKTFLRLAARRLNIHPNIFKFNPMGCGKTKEELQESWDWVNADDKFKILNHYGSLKSETLMEKMRYLVHICKCELIIFDHLSQSIAGLESENEVKDLDVTLSNFSAFHSVTPVHTVVVSHLNRKISAGFTRPKESPIWRYVDKEYLRGSSAIEGNAWNIVGIHREDNPDGSRGRIMFGVLKNREADSLGDTDITRMDRRTGLFYDASNEVWTPEGSGY